LEASQLTEETVAVHGMAAALAALQFLGRAQAETEVGVRPKLEILVLTGL
jgi:hypothetical protein